MSWDRLSLVTPPTDNIVLTLDDAKAQLRVQTTDDDDLISALILAAQSQIDGPKGIGVALISQTWRLVLDRWPEQIVLPLGPVQSVTSITYTAYDGTTQTLDPSQYIVDVCSEPCTVTRQWGVAWPAPRQTKAAIQVVFVAGFGDSASAVPPDIIHAMRLLVAHWYANREAVVGVENRDSSTELPLGVQALLDGYICGKVA